MADTKVSALPAAPLPLTGTEIVPLVSTGTTDRTTTQDIVNIGKIVSAATRLIGRGSAAGGGLQQEIQIDGTLTMAGTLLSVTPGTYGNAQTANPLSQFAATTSAQLAGVISDETGTGSLVFASAPTLANPVVGTQSQRDGSTKAASTAYVDVAVSTIPQNPESAAYTLVATDAGKHIFHPSADTTARIWTIPANSSVPFIVGTAITFVNQNAGGIITIAITTDTMRLAGAGTTGSRSLAANGIATALKVTSTEWLISGTGLT